MFDWLQRKVHDAVIAGVNSALAELAGVHQPAAALPPPVRLLLPPAATEPPGGDVEAPRGRGRGKAG